MKVPIWFASWSFCILVLSKEGGKLKTTICNWKGTWGANFLNRTISCQSVFVGSCKDQRQSSPINSNSLLRWFHLLSRISYSSKSLFYGHEVCCYVITDHLTSTGLVEWMWRAGIHIYSIIGGKYLSSTKHTPEGRMGGGEGDGFT